jgi:hypothetical protein
VSTPFASTGDIEARWRPLSDTEQYRAAMLLGDASELIRAKAVGVDERIAAGTTSAAVARMIAVGMVIRTLQNPEGVVQKTVGAVSVTLPTGRPATIALTEDELALLIPGAGRRVGMAKLSSPFCGP